MRHSANLPAVVEQILAGQAPICLIFVRHRSEYLASAETCLGLDETGHRAGVRHRARGVQETLMAKNAYQDIT